MVPGADRATVEDDLPERPIDDPRRPDSDLRRSARRVVEDVEALGGVVARRVTDGARRAVAADGAKPKSFRRRAHAFVIAEPLVALFAAVVTSVLLALGIWWLL